MNNPQLKSQPRNNDYSRQQGNMPAYSQLDLLFLLPNLQNKNHLLHRQKSMSVNTAKIVNHIFAIILIYYMKTYCYILGLWEPHIYFCPEIYKLQCFWSMISIYKSTTFRSFQSAIRYQSQGNRRSPWI